MKGAGGSGRIAVRGSSVVASRRTFVEFSMNDSDGSGRIAAKGSSLVASRRTSVESNVNGAKGSKQIAVALRALSLIIAADT